MVVADLNVIGARDTVEIIASTGGTAMAVLTNVAKEEDIQNLIDTAIKTYGTVDILVNNAGIMDNMDPAGDITDELWDRIFSVNTTSVMRSTRKVLPVFLAKGYGVIINIASVGGLYGSRAGAAYTASNMQLSVSQRTLVFSIRSGIRCNAIAPGSVQTNMFLLL